MASSTTTTTETERSFRDMWDEARNEFQRITKKSLEKKGNPSLEAVMRNLDSKFNSQESEQSPKKARLKELTGNVLSFIKLVGGLAAEGVSLVLGPVNMCFGAVQFLLDIPAVIEKFYEDIALLFEEVSAFLRQFKIYSRIEDFDQVDPELKKSTHNILINFVQICALSIEILDASTWKKIRTQLKVALCDNDSDVGKSLQNFQRLVTQQNNLSGAITLEHVLKSRTEHSSHIKEIYERLNTQAEENSRKLGESLEKVEGKLDDTNDGVKKVLVGQDALLAEARERGGARNHTKHVETVTSKLGIQLDKAQAPAKESEKLRNDNVKNTGAWLDKLPEYAGWAALQAGSEPLLVLTGGTGSGKSSLLAAVAERLKSASQVVEGSTTRVSVAQYTFMKSEKASKEGTGPELDQPTTAFKYMAAQLAHHNIVYAKELSLYLEKEQASFSTGMGMNELARTLFVPVKEKESKDVACVLLFDGVDQISEDRAVDLLETLLAIKSRKLRIAVAITQERLDNIQKSVGERLAAIPRIALEIHNEPDIKECIETQLQNRNHFQNKSEGIAQLKELIREKLPNLSLGNFSTVERTMKKIVDALDATQNMEDIKKILEEGAPPDNQDDEIEKVIARLNESLSEYDINVLNELIPWVVFAYRWFGVESMQQILYLGKLREPILGLEWMIRERYKDLLTIDGNSYVNTVNTDIFDYFLKSIKRSTKIETGSENDPSISLDIKINNLKISKVQRFFWDLSEKIMFDHFGKFDFEKALQDESSKTKIAISGPDSSLLLAKRCFELLFSDPDPKTATLVPYAMRSITGHLADLKEYKGEDDVYIEVLSHEESKELGQKLVSLLQSPKWIKQHLNDEWILEQAWLDKDRDLLWIWLWLKDPVAMSGLSPKDNDWLRSVISGANVDPIFDITKMLSHEWAHGRRWGATAIARWIDTYIDLKKEIQKQETTNEEDASKAPGSEDISDTDGENISDVQRLERAIDWIESTLEIKEKDSLWFERQGKTYLDTESLDTETLKRSIDAFLEAKKLPDCHWRVSEALATAYYRNNDTAKAIDELQVVLSHLRSQQNQTAQDKEDLARFNLRSGEWRSEMGRNEEAITDIREAISYNANLWDAYYKLFTTLVDHGQKDEAIQVLQNLDAEPALDDKLRSRIQHLFIELARYDDPTAPFGSFLNSIEEGQLIQTILERIEHAVSFLSAKPEEYRPHIVLLLYRGFIHAHYVGDDNGWQIAGECWRKSYDLLIQQSNLSDSSWETVHTIAVSCLTNYHFAAALSAMEDPKASESHVNKLIDCIHGLRENYNFAQMVRAPLSSFYAKSGQLEKTKQLLQTHLKSALDLLSDDEEENDLLGYFLIAENLKHAGDDLNALTAWSLLKPNESESERPQPTQSNEPEDKSDKNISVIEGSTEGIIGQVQTTDKNASAQVEVLTEPSEPSNGNEPTKSEGNDTEQKPEEGKNQHALSNQMAVENATQPERIGNAEIHCDGKCGKIWTYADDMWDCKICFNVVFCADCIPKLRNGALKQYVCSKDHEWLHVPPWSDVENDKTGKGNVLVGGELIDGKRVGGEVVTIEQWLDNLRTDWGIEKPEATTSAPGTEPAPTSE